MMNSWLSVMPKNPSSSSSEDAPPLLRSGWKSCYCALPAVVVLVEEVDCGTYSRGATVTPVVPSTVRAAEDGVPTLVTENAEALDWSVKTPAATVDSSVHHSVAGTATECCTAVPTLLRATASNATDDDAFCVMV